MIKLHDDKKLSCPSHLLYPHIKLSSIHNNLNLWTEYKLYIAMPIYANLKKKLNQAHISLNWFVGNEELSVISRML